MEYTGTKWPPAAHRLIFSGTKAVVDVRECGLDGLDGRELNDVVQHFMCILGKFGYGDDN